MKLYNLKVKNGWFDSSFFQMLKLQKDMLPKYNTLLDYTYDAKMLIKSLGLHYDMIYACPNDCILYQRKYESKYEFPTCIKS